MFTLRNLLPMFALVTLLSGHARAEEGQPKPKKTGGTVTDVNEDAKAITLTTKGDGQAKKTIVQLADKGKVFVDGKEAKLKDVPKNARAEVQYTSATKEGDLIATEIRIVGKERRFLVDKIEGNKLFYKEEGSLMSQPIADGVEVLIGKDAGKLTDVKSGDMIYATFKADESGIIKIHVPKKNEKEKE
jgi:hypothetical protein